MVEATSSKNVEVGVVEQSILPCGATMGCRIVALSISFNYSVFSPRGQAEFEESFNDLNYKQFRITVTEMDNDWMCLVK